MTLVVWFVVLLCVTVAFMLYRRILLSRTPDPKTVEALSEMHPYALAYLAGGRVGAAYASASNLYRLGLIEIVPVDDSHLNLPITRTRLQVTPQEAPATLHPLDYEMLHFLSNPAHELDLSKAPSASTWQWCRDKTGKWERQPSLAASLLEVANRSGHRVPVSPELNGTMEFNAVASSTPSGAALNLRSPQTLVMMYGMAFGAAGMSAISTGPDGGLEGTGMNGTGLDGSGLGGNIGT